jgi:hypothetical protein
MNIEKIIVKTETTNQVSEDTWRRVNKMKVFTPETTLKEVVQWVRAINADTDIIQIYIETK